VLRILPLISLGSAVLFLTLYGAGIYPWTVCTVLLAFAVTGLLVRRKGELAPPRAKSGLTIPALYAALLIFIVIILIPLPLPLTHLTGGTRFDQNRTVVDVLTQAKALDVETTPFFAFSTTRNRAGTLRALLLFATLFGAWDMARHLNGPLRLLWLRGLIGLGSVVAVLGHLGKWVFPQGDTLWWTIPVPHGLPGPVGGFINPNHFAGFVALLAPVALATAISDAQKQRWGRMAGAVVGFVIMTLALLFSLSRGGIVAYAGGVGMMAAISFFRAKTIGKLALATTMMLIIGGGVALALQHDQVRERLLSLRSPATTTSLQERIGAWIDTAGMLRSYPLVGVGPNAFVVTYPQHRTSSSRAARDFAENEYVQVIGETGIVGGILLALFIFIMVRQSRRALSHSEAPESACALACVGAAAVAATHAIVDFPLHLPLYAITAATLAGCLWPQLNDSTPDDAIRWPHVVAIAVAVLCLGLGSTIRLDSRGLLSGAPTPRITRALVWSPTSALAWRRLCAKLSTTDSHPQRVLGERCLTQAATYDPNNYPLWRRLGEVRQSLGDNRGANQAYRRVEALRDWIKLPTLPERAAPSTTTNQTQNE
jgi:O-antigen ligase